MSSEVLILIIAILTFFILLWIFRRLTKYKSRRNLTSIVGTVIIATILYVGFIIVFFSYQFHEPQYEFDREKWLAEKHTRFEMSDDVVKSGMLIGKTKSEVIEFIGKPESDVTTDLWTYDIGMSGAGLGWQFNFLKLTFENGKVSDVKKIEIID